MSGIALRVPAIGVTIAASLLLRLLFAWGLGFGVDEAYAVTVARPFSLSYFDHAPLHFWLAGIMTWSTGSTEPLVVRLPFLLAFAGTQWAVAQLARYAYNETAARLTAVALGASGVLGMTSGSWVLPDGPLLLFGALGVLVLAPVLAPADERNLALRPDDARWRWLTAGVCLGLAVLSKYHGLLYVAGVGLYTVWHRETRRQLASVWPWLALIIVAAALGPMLWWNATHEWASFAFQGARVRSGSGDWSVAPFAEMVAGQLGWLLPWIGIPLLLAVWQAPRNRASRLLLFVATGPILIFTLIPLGGARGLPHWPAPGWLFVFPLLGAWLQEALKHERRWAWWWWRGAVPATLLLVLVVVAHGRWRLLDPMLSPQQQATEPTRDAVSWRAAVAPSDADVDVDVLLVRSWIQGGQLGVAVGAEPLPMLCLCDDPHHFAFRFTTEMRPWTRGLLVERLQPWRRDWRPASTLGGDSLTIVVRDTIEVDRAVQLVRYDVTRRMGRSASGAW